MGIRSYLFFEKKKSFVFSTLAPYVVYLIFHCGIMARIYEAYVNEIKNK